VVFDIPEKRFITCPECDQTFPYYFSDDDLQKFTGIHEDGSAILPTLKCKNCKILFQYLGFLKKV